LLHLAGDVSAAEAHYRRAVAAASADAIAWFNLAVALEDRGSAGEALAAYDRALAVDPGLADAHHNSARLCERLGRPAEALRRLSALRRLMRT
jgi:tetratricopeptide (TPR) repeat protein